MGDVEGVLPELAKLLGQGSAVAVVVTVAVATVAIYRRATVTAEKAYDLLLTSSTAHYQARVEALQADFEAHRLRVQAELDDIRRQLLACRESEQRLRAELAEIRFNNGPGNSGGV